MRSAVSALGAVLVLGAAGTAVAAAPTPVSAPSGGTTTHIDARLTQVAVLNPVVTSAATGRQVDDNPGEEAVRAYGRDGRVFINLDRLDPHDGPYAICVDATGLDARRFPDDPVTGYQSRCAPSVPWIPRHAVPSSAGRYRFAPGQRRTIGVRLPLAGAIAGRVISRTGRPIAGIDVRARNDATGTIYGVTTTGPRGYYTLPGLPPASGRGYGVCFTPSAAVVTGVGFRPQCYHNVPTSGGFAKRATRVGVTLGRVHRGVNQALPYAGAVSGTVVDAATGRAVHGRYSYLVPTVVAFTTTGRQLASTNTAVNGRYVLRGLPVGKVKVCVERTYVSDTTSYTGACWRSVAWNGGSVPRSAAAITVTRARYHAGIRIPVRRNPAPTPAPTGAIAGTVTDAATSLPVANVSVYVASADAGPPDFNGPGVVTDAQGRYLVRHLPAAGYYDHNGIPTPTAYYVCVVQQDAATSPPAPPTGWAPNCYGTAQWTGGSSGLRTVTVHAARTTDGIDVTLAAGGAVTGTVTDEQTGRPVSGIAVEARRVDSHSFDNLGGGTGDDGVYTVKGLLPGARYRICFVGDAGEYDEQGYVDECYDNAPYD